MVAYLQNSVHIYAYTYYIYPIEGKFPSHCTFPLQPLSNWSFIRLLLSCCVHEMETCVSTVANTGNILERLANPQPHLMQHHQEACCVCVYIYIC